VTLWWVLLGAVLCGAVLGFTLAVVVLVSWVRFCARDRAEAAWKAQRSGKIRHMSAEKIEGIDAAVRGFVEEQYEGAQMLAGFVVFYAVMDADGQWLYEYTTSSGLAPHAATGLAAMSSEAMDKDLQDD
jgi:hypothetical protein